MCLFMYESVLVQSVCACICETEMYMCERVSVCHARVYLFNYFN